VVTDGLAGGFCANANVLIKTKKTNMLFFIFVEIL
jgi:hypothetical protein